MLQLVKCSYWWPSMKAYINKYVETCDPCQRTKSITCLPKGELHPLEIPLKPLSHILCDFIVKLPNSMGYDSILVVVDSFTKMAHFIPTCKDIDAPGVAELFLNYIWKLHGTPDSVVSDRGAVFASHFLRELYQRLDIKPQLSSAYHPQTDGQTERVNQVIENFLRIYTSHRQDNWAELLPFAKFAYNNMPHSSTGFSPFFANTGHHLHISPTNRVELDVPAVDKNIAHLQEIQKEVLASLQLAK